MGIKALLLCLLQFLIFFSFVAAIPTEPLRSYVDCSKYGSPQVSWYINVGLYFCQFCPTANFHLNIYLHIQVVIPNGKCFYGPSDWQTYPALASFVLNEYPSGVDQSNLLLQVKDQDPIPYSFVVTNSTWSGPSENEEFICICYWFL